MAFPTSHGHWRGGGPHVKVFDGVTGNEIRSFFAYDSGFTGGCTWRPARQWRRVRDIIGVPARCGRTSTVSGRTQLAAIVLRLQCRVPPAEFACGG